MERRDFLVRGLTGMATVLVGSQVPWLAKAASAADPDPLLAQAPAAAPLIIEELEGIISSTHTERFNRPTGEIVSKDTFSFRTRFELPEAEEPVEPAVPGAVPRLVAGIDENTTIDLTVGAISFSGRLGDATKSTLARKDPATGGNATFIETDGATNRPTQVVTFRWSRLGVASLSLRGTPPPDSNTNIVAAGDLVVEEPLEAPNLVAVIVPTSLVVGDAFGGVGESDLEGRRTIRQSPGGELTSWRLLG